MGFNTTAVILNDALGEIKNDPKFGEALYHAVLEVNQNNGSYVIAGCHANAVRVIETHHADGVSLIAVGGNTAQVVMSYACGYNLMFEEDFKLEILKRLADDLGYRVVKKAQK